MRHRLTSALILGLACALLGGLFLLSPWGWAREESVGLHALFRLRGPQAAPAGVTVVAITKAASEALGVPYEPKQWPRSLHAELISRLHDAGARSIVFDLLFRETRAGGDAELAAAIEAAGNVLLLEFLEKRVLGVASSGRADGPAAVHRLVPPVAPVAAAAVATGPFTLPKVPQQVAQFWTFDRNAGDVPSMPLLALLVHARSVAAPLRQALDRMAPDLAARLRSGSSSDVDVARTLIAAVEPLARLLRQRPELRARIVQAAADPQVPRTAPGVSTQLDAVLAALTDPPSRYLNFYGPPWSVRTVPYDQALRELSGAPGTAGLQAWAGHAVFVGLSSPVQWEQQDEFITPFSDPASGHDLSGIEILATAFANLLNRTTLRPLSPVQGLLLVLGWGLLIGLAARLTTPLWAAIAVLAFSAGYLLASLHLFGAVAIWLPLVTPLLLQVPLALFAATAWHYRDAKRDRLRIRELFGYYLPEPVVERLVREGLHPGHERESVFGVCLYSDAAHYSSLSEGMAPEALADYMNAYYEVIFEPVRRHGGIISDVVGDAMMAIWAARRDDIAVREAACQAALEIQQALQRHAEDDAAPLLSTRIGLHCGEMAMAHVGARDHFEYRAVGDIVNTASRLEALNKELGTSVLVSAETLRNLDRALTKPLGSFSLPGKRAPVEVCELIGWGSSAVGRQ